MLHSFATTFYLRMIKWDQIAQLFKSPLSLLPSHTPGRDIKQFKDPCQAINIFCVCCCSAHGSLHLLFPTGGSAGILPQSFISLFFFFHFARKEQVKKERSLFHEVFFSEMKLGTAVWQEHVFLIMFPIQPGFARIRNPHILQQWTAGFNAFLKKRLFHVSAWRALESIP